jgi:osmoprotectant transport system substrate-binding protein
VSSYRAAGVLSITLLVAALSACGSATVHDPPTALRDDAITVASFNFAESEVLAEIYSEALESGGYRVKRTFGLGTRELVTPALAQGLVEFVPEYAGTALAFLSLGHEHGTSDIASTHDRLAVAAAKDDLRVLQAAPAQDANTFVVTKNAASAGGLRRVSDLSATAGRMTLGGPPECPKRPQCLLGLRDLYGLSFPNFIALDAGGPVTRQALRNGYIDVALLFTTDPTIATGEFVPLADDLGLQPAENVTPLVRHEVVDRWGPKLVAVIDGVSARLTTEDLRQLNAQLLVPGANVRAVAGAWLEKAG